MKFNFSISFCWKKKKNNKTVFILIGIKLKGKKNVLHWQIVVPSVGMVNERQHIANYTGTGTYSKTIAVTHHPEWATCGYFISWARWFIARSVIFHPRSYSNEVIDCVCEGASSKRERLNFYFTGTIFPRICRVHYRPIRYIYSPTRFARFNPQTCVRRRWDYTRNEKNVEDLARNWKVTGEDQSFDERLSAASNLPA